MSRDISNETSRSLTWYGIGFGAIIAIGAAYFGAGLGIIATIVSIVPTITNNNAAMNTQIITSLNEFMIKNLLIGGGLMGLGVTLSWLAIFKAKKRKHEQRIFWNYTVYSKIENIQNQLFDLKLSLITNEQKIEKDLSLKNRYESIVSGIESEIKKIEDDVEKNKDVGIINDK